MHFNPEQLRQNLQKIQSEGPHNAMPRLCLGLSGGLDSVVLLHALVAVGFKPKVIHVHHGLSDNADQWAAFCERLCNEFGVPFVCVRVQVSSEGKGIEDAARRARYQAFAQHMSARDALLSAHHLDDQAETVLLRLMRGSGPKGLAAMSSRRGLGIGELWRPLLGVPRVELERYAQTHDLRWVEDESNRDEGFERNFLRQKVMPLLAERWPGFAERWQQSATLCGDLDALACDQANEDLISANWRAERLGFSFDLSACADFKPARWRQLLRRACEQAKLEPPGLRHLEALDQQLSTAKGDALIVVSWGRCSLRPFQGRLYLLPAEPEVAGSQALEIWRNPRVWDPTLELKLGDGSLLARAGIGLGCLSIEKHTVSVGLRQGGERCQPAGRPHSQTLKKLLQEFGLEPWLRPVVPLLYIEGVLAAVGDLWVCEGFQAKPGEAGAALQWSMGNRAPSSKEER